MKTRTHHILLLAVLSSVAVINIVAGEDEIPRRRFIEEGKTWWYTSKGQKGDGYRNLDHTSLPLEVMFKGDTVFNGKKYHKAVLVSRGMGASLYQHVNEIIAYYRESDDGKVFRYYPDNDKEIIKYDPETQDPHFDFNPYDIHEGPFMETQMGGNFKRWQNYDLNPEANRLWNDYLVEGIGYSSGYLFTSQTNDTGDYYEHDLPEFPKLRWVTDSLGNVIYRGSG